MKSLGFSKFRFVLSFGTLLVFLLSCHIAFGQTNSSSVKGVIKDPQGSVVAGATVTLSDPTTNFTRSTTSNDSGQFSFEGIQPGTYKVDVEAKGFKKAVLNEVV